jgi:hypothetical protein
LFGNTLRDEKILEKFSGAYLSARVESLKAKVWSKKYKRTLVENNYKIVDGTCEFYKNGIPVKTLKTTWRGLLVRDDSSNDLSSPRKIKTNRDVKLGQ